MWIKEKKINKIKRRMNNMKDTFTFEHMGTASNEYLRKALENPEQYQKEQMNERKKALEVIEEILKEDEEIKNKKHIKRIK